MRMTVQPMPARLHREHVTVALLTGGTSAPIRLPPGRYRAHFHIDGTDWTAWTQRVSEPVILAVYGMVESRSEELTWSSRAWFETNRRVMGTVAHPRFRRPLVEKIEAPWWTTVPLAHAYTLEFVLDEEQDILFLMDYRGAAGLTCPSVRVDSMTDRNGTTL